MIINLKEISKTIFIAIATLILFTLYNYIKPTPVYHVLHTPFSNTYTIDLTDQVKGDRTAYYELSKLIEGLDKDDTVIFDMHSFGGDVAAMQMLINAMDKTEAHVIANVIGGNYSAGAVITCHADEIKMSPNSYLMFHNARNASGVLPPGDFRTALNESLNACVPHGILTQTDISNMNSATDDIEIYWYPKPPVAEGPK